MSTNYTLIKKIYNLNLDLGGLKIRGDQNQDLINKSIQINQKRILKVLANMISANDQKDLILNALEMLKRFNFEK